MLFQHEETMRRLGNNEELFREFVQIFREDSPGIIDSLKQAADRGDSTAFGQSAHAVKGLVSNFGADAAVVLAAELEASEFEAGSEEIKRRIQKFESMVKQLDDELKDALGE